MKGIKNLDRDHLIYNRFFGLAALSLLLTIVFWNGLWGGAPRADQLIYLHTISKYQNLSDILANAPSWNRTNFAGDHILYRPILFIQMGFFYYFFKYNFLYWQIASLVLHILVTAGLYILSHQGKLKNSLYPFLLSALFGVSFLSSELVLWNHISGYITFSLFSVYAVLFSVKYLRTNKTMFGIAALVLGVLAEFTYELGVIVNGLLAIVLLHSHLFTPRSPIKKNSHLVLLLLFFCGVMLYPALSILDLTIRGFHVSNIGGSAPFGIKLLHATWYALQQISFWIGGLFFPSAYDIRAGDRSSFKLFNLAGEFVIINFSAIAFAIGFFSSRIKRWSLSAFVSNIGGKATYALPAFIFLCFYSLAIAFGRALPRGLDYVLNINVYYQYIACASLLVMVATYFLREAPDRTGNTGSSNQLNDRSKHNAAIIFALVTLILFNANSTYKLATEFRYIYSPPRLEVINAVQAYIQANPNSNSYFVMGDSCPGNVDLPWFGKSGHFRKSSEWKGGAHYADVLFPEKSWELNKERLSEADFDLTTVNCTTIRASSTFDNYGPSGLTSAADPGWHARTPIVFPQTLDLNFGYIRKLNSFHFLPQQGLSARAPKTIAIEISDNHTDWRLIYKGDLGCKNDSEDWRSVSMDNTVNARYARINILSNCGDPTLLTLRGLRLN